MCCQMQSADPTAPAPPDGSAFAGVQLKRAFQRAAVFGKEGSAHLDGVRSAARDSRLRSRPQQRRSLEAGRDAEQQQQ
jgi:hypothetical protein